MNREIRREIFEVVGIIAVLFSLAVLIIEVRQNTSALYAASRQALMEGSRDEILLLLEHPDITLTMIKQLPLTPEEQLRLDSFWATSLRSREFAWLQYKEGGLDTDLYDTELAVLKLTFDSSRARIWWKVIGREYFSESFVSFVDRQLEKNPPTDTLWEASISWAD